MHRYFCHIIVKYICHMEQNVVGLFASLLLLYCVVVWIGSMVAQDSSRLWAVNEASKLFQTSVGDFSAGRHLPVEKMDTDKTVKEKSKFIVRVILKNALEQIGVIHVMTKYSKLCKLQYYKTRSGGPSGRLWALWACLTSSFAPFGRSCRVTHATVQ